MTTTSNARPMSPAAARVLALLVAANGRADPRELQALEALDAFRRLGMPRQHFVTLVEECVAEIGAHLAECSWLRAHDQAIVDRLLDAVTDPAERLALCRMAAAVITADGQVTSDERLVWDYTLARWHIHRSQVTEAIRSDRGAPRDAAQPIA